MVTKYVLKYAPIGTGVDIYFSGTTILNSAVLFPDVPTAISVGILNRTVDPYHNEAVVMCVEVEEDTVLPSRDVSDQPLPPKK